MIEHESILTDVQKRVLHAVGPFARRAGFYLAGGTAVALRFGHRRSEDFDWFAPALSRPDALLSDLQAEGLSLQETQIEAGTVISRIEGVKISFFDTGIRCSIPWTNGGSTKRTSRLYETSQP